MIRTYKVMFLSNNKQKKEAVYNLTLAQQSGDLKKVANF
ncbi:hypothetical protein A0O32_2182 [Anoxybacillus flavithermus]|nr:hypothetical protein A0O32_2182 [Anoxybacillus flavithermus]